MSGMFLTAVKRVLDYCQEINYSINKQKLAPLQTKIEAVVITFFPPYFILFKVKRLITPYNMVCPPRKYNFAYHNPFCSSSGQSRCSQSDNPLLKQYYSERSDQTLSG